jgi:hypothetical protein
VLVVLALAVGCGKGNDNDLLAQLHGDNAATASPTECDEWKATMTKYLACDKVPIDARTALKQGFDATVAKWPMLAAEDKAQLASTCGTGVEAIHAMMKSTGCE